MSVFSVIKHVLFGTMNYNDPLVTSFTHLSAQMMEFFLCLQSPKVRTSGEYKNMETIAGRQLASQLSAAAAAMEQNKLKVSSNSTVKMESSTVDVVTVDTPAKPNISISHASESGKGLLRNMEIFLTSQKCWAAKWIARLTSDNEVLNRIPLEAEFSSLLYGASLHRVFHYHPSSLHGLRNVEKDVEHQTLI